MIKKPQTSHNQIHETMSDIPVGRLVFAVAQRPFDSVNPETQIVTTFGTLIPVMDGHGFLAKARDYPKAGLVWWLVWSSARAYAEPGRLVSARLEYAKRFDDDDPEASFYQVEIESIEPLRSSVGYEILTVAPGAAASERDFLNVEGLITVDHPPSDQVLVSWCGHVYGPFRVSFAQKSEREYLVTLHALGPDRDVRKIPEPAIAALRSGTRVQSSQTVSLDDKSVPNALRTHRCTYDILTAAAWSTLEAGPYERLSLLRDADVMKRVAKTILARKERQQLSALLDRLADELSRTGAAPIDVIELIGNTQAQLRRGGELADEVAAALVKSGLIDPAIAKQIDERVQEHMAANASALRTEMAALTRKEQDELERLRENREKLERELENVRQTAQTALSQELNEARAQHDERMLRESVDIAEQRADLERQRTDVIEQLDAVRLRYEESRRDVLTDFLTLQPLLEKILPRGSDWTNSAATTASLGEANLTALSADTTRRADSASLSQAPLQLPAFVRGGLIGVDATSEREFMERFRVHVKASGFEYRELDLLSFHLSVKCGDLTILAGLSGTGKSTLPRLYAEALAGETPADPLAPEGRYLHLGVRPSWLDQQDLLGHVNGIDRRFVPSDSGLYEFAVWAQTEYTAKRGSSGMYLACLDEMNLSHVEHYFSGFLQALERAEGLRAVRCFDLRAVSDEDPFREFSQLNIPRTIRFVGTVNYDETTKPLSVRLLDRANVLQLAASNLRGPSIGRGDAAPVRATGAPIQFDHLRSWVRDDELEKPIAEFLDRISASLHALQTPLTPRRDRAIRRFVASASGVQLSAWSAFDLQIVQRIVPQIRSVFTSENRRGLEELVRLVRSEAAELPESARVLSAIHDREIGQFDG